MSAKASGKTRWSSRNRWRSESAVSRLRSRCEPRSRCRVGDRFLGLGERDQQQRTCPHRSLLRGSNRRRPQHLQRVGRDPRARRRRTGRIPRAVLLHDKFVRRVWQGQCRCGSYRICLRGGQRSVVRRYIDARAVPRRAARGARCVREDRWLARSRAFRRTHRHDVGPARRRRTSQRSGQGHRLGTC